MTESEISENNELLLLLVGRSVAGSRKFKDVVCAPDMYLFCTMIQLKHAQQYAMHLSGKTTWHRQRLGCLMS